jgi:hypothetical protein
MDQMVACFCCVKREAVTFSAKTRAKGQTDAAVQRNTDDDADATKMESPSSGTVSTANTSHSSSAPSSAPSSEAQLAQARVCCDVSHPPAAASLEGASMKKDTSSSSRTTATTLSSVVDLTSSNSSSSNSSAADGHMQEVGVDLAPVLDIVSPVNSPADLEVS